MTKLFSAAIAASICLTGAASAAPPVEAYGALPDVWGLDISPSGERFAYFSHRNGEDYFVISELGKGVIGGGKTGDVKPRRIFFPNNSFAVVIGSETLSTNFYRGKWENSSAFSYDIEKENFATLLKGYDKLYTAQSGLGRIVGKLDGEDVVFMPAYVGDYRSTPDYALLKVKLNHNSASVASGGAKDAIDWFVGGDGAVLAREDFDDESKIYRIFTGKNGPLTKIFEKHGSLNETGTLVGITPDRAGLVFNQGRSEDDDEFTSFSKMSFTGEIVGPAFNIDQNRSVERAITDINRVVYGVEYSGLRPSYTFADPDLDRDVKEVAANFPDDAVHFEGFTKDFKSLVFLIEGGGATPAYYLYNREAKQLGRLAQKYANIKDEDVNPILTIEYKARDGRKIPSIVTLPRGKTIKQSLPLIVLPHGGPAAYDAVGFDWMAQFFASRGYMVFQPNFRGSYGFGREHRVAGHGEWGGKMQDDITDGVKLLVDQQWADPGRVCIVGGSYGGYAALAGGAYTPDLYKCVVAIAPVSDLDLFLTTVKRNQGSSSSVYEYWTKLIGDKKSDKEKIASISPVNAANNFKAPVLLIHGNDDTVVPFLHSIKMESALKSAGKSVSLVKLKREDHWLSQADTRLQTLQAIESFLTETNPAN
ncbi:MAG: S9 family peptidase [Parvularculaceae bacterium]|nr:S9 family peptidase [Parvularculaceae bacterium]